MIGLILKAIQSTKPKPEFVPPKLHELSQKQSFWITMIAVILSRGGWFLLTLSLAVAVLIWALK